MTDEAVWELFEQAMENEQLGQLAKYLLLRGHYMVWKRLRNALYENRPEDITIDILRFLFPMDVPLGLMKWRQANGYST